jgi:hypothetical protein
LRLAGRSGRPRGSRRVVSLICGGWVPQDLDFVARSACLTDPTSGPRPPTRSSNPSPPTAHGSMNHDTSRAAAATAALRSASRTASCRHRPMTCDSTRSGARRSTSTPTSTLRAMGQAAVSDRRRARLLQVLTASTWETTETANRSERQLAKARRTTPGPRTLLRPRHRFGTIPSASIDALRATTFAIGGSEAVLVGERRNSAKPAVSRQPVPSLTA